MGFSAGASPSLAPLTGSSRVTESEFDSIDRTGGPGSGTDGPSSFREWLIAFGALTMLAGILVLSWPGLTVLAMTVIVGLQMLTNAEIAPDVTAAALEVNGRARIDGLRSALAV